MVQVHVYFPSYYSEDEVAFVIPSPLSNMAADEPVEVVVVVSALSGGVFSGASPVLVAEDASTSALLEVVALTVIADAPFGTGSLPASEGVSSVDVASVELITAALSVDVAFTAVVEALLSVAFATRLVDSVEVLIATEVVATASLLGGGITRALR